MAHTSELAWAEVAARVSQFALALTSSIRDGEEGYQELLEAYTFAGGTDALFAALLFKTTTPDSTQISKAVDIRQAAVAAHELYGALTNAATTTRDRASVLRRMT